MFKNVNNFDHFDVKGNKIMQVFQNQLNSDSDSDNGGDGFRYLLVALFLSVLAFFILLNSISEVSDDKTEKILDKVREEFDGKDAIAKFLKGFDNKEELAIAMKQSEEFSLREIIENFLQLNSELVHTDFTMYDDKIKISIEEHILFFSGETDMKKRAGDFLNELTELMAKYAPMESHSVVLSYHFSGYKYEFDALPKMRLNAVKEHFERNNVKNMIPVEMGFITNDKASEDFKENLKIVIIFE